MLEPVQDDRRAAWRAGLARAGLDEAQLAELEDHLDAALLARRAEGLAPEAALRAALDALGPTAVVAAEFRKLRRPMKLSSKLLGLLFSGALVALAVSHGSRTSLAVFLDVPSLLLVLGFVLGGLLASFGPQRLARAFAAGLRREPVACPAERALHLQVARRGYRLAWGSGVLGSLLGAIQALTNLADPSALGPAAALVLLSLLYGALLAELLFGNLAQWVAGDPHVA